MNLPKVVLPGPKLACLQIMLLSRRVGTINSLTVTLLLLALLAGAWHQRDVQLQTDIAVQALLRTQQSLHTAQSLPEKSPLSVSQSHLKVFHDLLGDQTYAEQQVKTIFAIANKNGLSLNHGEYQSAYDKDGEFFTYQATLPIKGPYAAIRAFCEQTLLAIPFASVAEISFKRDAIGSPLAEASIRFIFFLRDWEPSSSAARLHATRTGSEVNP